MGLTKNHCMKKILFVCFMTFAQCLVAQQGLLGEYFDGENFEKKIATRTDDKIDFYWDFKAPMNGMAAESFSIRWTGNITAPESGKFLISCTVDDGVRVWIDNQPIINAWNMHDKTFFSNYANLEKGKSYDIKIEYFNGIREGMIKLKWQLPSEKPVFGGMLGSNEKIISSKYFSAPVKKLTVTQNGKPVSEKAPNAAPQKVENKPKVKTVTPSTPLATNAPKIKPPKDTLNKYTPRNILFAKSTTTMIGESYLELNQLSNMLAQYPMMRVHIEGHTDIVGDAALNQTLSEERAAAVKNYLVQKGIQPNRLVAKGFGGSRPIYKSGNEQNRRVEFFFN